MRVTRAGVTFRFVELWAATWVVWLATALAAPVPPWQAAGVLEREQREAKRLAERPFRAEVWSIDIGGPWQAAALEDGWSQPEAFIEGGNRRSFVWIEGESARVRFVSPGWPTALLTLAASPLPQLTPLPVHLLVDGERRATLRIARGWTVSSVAVGAIPAGPHVLELRPAGSATPPSERRALSLAVDGIAIAATPVAEPARDRGVFAGFLALGLDDRPAVFVDASAAISLPPSQSWKRHLGSDLAAWYGFGIGGRVTPLTPLVAVVNGIAAALLIVLLSGLGWALLLRAQGIARLILGLAFSSATLLLVLAVLRVLGVGPRPVPLAVGLALAGGLPLLRLGRDGELRLSWPLGLSGLVAAAILGCFATVVVPPLQDQDMETQGTAHALANRQVPGMLTDRGVVHFFAHPPLLHLWQAGTFTLSGRLPRVAYYDEAAQTLLQEAGASAERKKRIQSRAYQASVTRLVRRFFAEPQLWPTRQVSVVLAALAVALLAHLAGVVTGHGAAGVVLALVWLSFPEVLVRGGYGGYFAATALLSLLVLAGLEANAGRGSLMTAGALGFLVNQKGLLVPVAWAVGAARATGRARFLPLVGGLAAVAAFAVYGLAVDAPAFLGDFLREHVLERLDARDVRFRSAAGIWYPSIPELWKEFVAHYGFVFTALAVLAAARGLASRSPAVRAAAWSVVLGAVVFSVTDWRQTKHLALLAAPALVAVAGSWPSAPTRRRLGLAVLLLLIVRNLWTAWPLLTRFDALAPGTTW
jgi:hypothetical protein